MFKLSLKTDEEFGWAVNAILTMETLFLAANGTFLFPKIVRIEEGIIETACY